MGLAHAQTIARPVPIPSKTGATTMDQARIDSYRSAAELAADQQRGIQKRIDELDAKRTRSEGSKDGSRHAKSGAKTASTPQAGARKQPTNPLPQQHQKKPGDESQLRPAPDYEPRYPGSGTRCGKVALITGGDSGIGRAVAVLSRARAPMSRSSI